MIIFFDRDFVVILIVVKVMTFFSNVILIITNGRCLNVKEFVQRRQRHNNISKQTNNFFILTFHN